MHPMPARGLFAALLVSGFGTLAMSLPTQAVVTFEWIAVGDPGNAGDPPGFFGAVPDPYQISKFEVTNSQYAEFLNAVAVLDNGLSLFDPNMELSPLGGIIQSGAPFAFSYSVKPGFENRPVNFVSLLSILRFVNWMQNGQPMGPGPGSTEDGTYDLLESPLARNPAATIFLPNEDEWYKAAYYDPISGTYFDFPTSTDTTVVCAIPSATPNSANCDNVVGAPTDVGSYAGSPSPIGTFDQAGNVQERLEVDFASGRVGGGSFSNPAVTNFSLAFGGLNSDPFSGLADVGFRVVGRSDADGDGVNDDFDNCIDDPNEDQSDVDADGAGDVCDPSPNHPNRLDECLADLVECEAGGSFPDADGDGEADATDLCPDTLAGEAVDTAGCSQSEFCGAFTVGTFHENLICRLSDWMNDEPIVPRDCKPTRNGCVPR